MHYLNENFAKDLPKGDWFQHLQAMEGKVYREVQGRKTLQFALGGKSYFIKNHFGVGWREILKNLVLLRMPILGAENEWRAISKLKSLGLTTMTSIAYGSRGWNPARRQSLIVTEDLANTVSLEDYCKDWRQNSPEFARKQKLLSKLASISRTLHQGGVCHRDYYLCHFLMPKDCLDVASNQAFELFVIDLHRALIKNRLGLRWIIKDVSGLLYSAMDIGLTQRDFFRFIKIYDDMSLRDALAHNGPFWNSVQKRALSMHKKLGSVS
ncbi:MAG: lipopolysaccharide core heptose(I) kinase RfaP [Gammaproteobacteria bacterium]|nr:lipopolysaccharide core heptose(I) kinase RfaP [Gammaproteobacteria bacterium]MBL4728342.1 lipopolysaccharide core heptose(I) kinase RfaP [Gammaproteobacteria bacterium]